MIACKSKIIIDCIHCLYLVTILINFNSNHNCLQLWCNHSSVTHKLSGIIFHNFVAHVPVAVMRTYMHTPCHDGSSITGLALMLITEQPDSEVVICIDSMHIKTLCLL